MDDTPAQPARRHPVLGRKATGLPCLVGRAAHDKAVVKHGNSLVASYTQGTTVAGSPRWHAAAARLQPSTGAAADSQRSSLSPRSTARGSRRKRTVCDVLAKTSHMSDAVLGRRKWQPWNGGHAWHNVPGVHREQSVHVSALARHCTGLPAPAQQPWSCDPLSRGGKGHSRHVRKGHFTLCLGGRARAHTPRRCRCSDMYSALIGGGRDLRRRRRPGQARRRRADQACRP